MSNTIATRADTLTPSCSTVEDLFRSEEVKASIQRIIGQKLDLDGLSLQQKIELLAKNGTISGNNIKKLLSDLRLKYSIEDLQGKERMVVAFILAIEQIEQAVNPGFLRKMVGELAHSVGNSHGVDKENGGQFQSKVSKDLRSILEKDIVSILASQDSLSNNYLAMLEIGFSPINDLGEIIEPLGINLSTITNNKNDTAPYLKVTSKSLGIHYIDKRGNILKIGKKMVKKIEEREVYTKGFLGSEKKEKVVLLYVTNEEIYYVTGNGYYSILPEQEPEFNQM